MHAVSIEYPRRYTGQIAMEDLVGSLNESPPRYFSLRFVGVEEAKLHFLRVFAEQRKVGAFAIPSCAWRIWVALPESE